MDGPITANNPMGVHHAWGRTYKDLWQKYKNMRGYRERFQNGFDCQGLWVEVEVEKELELRSKKDIEELVPGDKKASIDKFVNLCKARVLKFSGIQTEQTKRLGNFMDWENSYFTMSDDNNYMIWHFLKVCNDKGWIYKGRDSVPWCPRCETAISQHEMLTEDYKEVVHESVFFALPVEGEDFELLVWTTTPWTIPANVAVAVHPKYTYRVWLDKDLGRKFVILNANEEGVGLGVLERIQKLTNKFRNLEKVKDISGKELLKLKYKGAFDTLPAVEKARSENTETFHSVISAENLVTHEEGTGLVHIAPGAGVEDFALGREFKLPVVVPIDDGASYMDGFGDFSGKNAKKHPELILDYLKENNFAIATHHYKHRYPACWRCKTELVWKVADEWYISMDKVDPMDKKKRTLREEMKDVAKKIKWLPEFGLERELDWLGNMHDWLISKPNRYWGLALPIYECKKCGNFEVLGSREELKKRAVEGWESFDGHTPHKPWIDEPKIKCSECGEIVERLPDVGNVWLDAGIVPFSTIKENNVGEPLYLKDKKEWQKWFPASFITESFPGQFKNWFYSMIAMGTVLENTNSFENVLGFGTLLAEDGRAMHKSWGNSIEFNEGADKMGADVMRFMFARTNPSDNMLFGYKLADETRRQFHLKLWNIYNYFVTYSNLDGWEPKNSNKSEYILDKWIISRLNNTIFEVEENLDKYNAQTATLEIESFVDDLSNWYVRRSRDLEDKTNFYETMHKVLITLSQILSPFMPYLSEEMYKNLTKELSVHLSDWPTVEKNLIDTKLEEEMNYVREIVEMGLSARKDSGIKVRQPLASITIDHKNQLLDFSQDLDFLLKDELNIKSVLKVKQVDNLAVKLDTTITPALKDEGEARDLIRQIQEERKNLGTKLDQLIDVTLPDWPKSQEEYIQKKALIKNLSKGEFSVTPQNNV